MATPWLTQLLCLFMISFLVTQGSCGQVEQTRPLGPQTPVPLHSCQAAPGAPGASCPDPFPIAERNLEVKATLTLDPVEPQSVREPISIAQPPVGFEEPQPGKSFSQSVLLPCTCDSDGPTAITRCEIFSDGSARCEPFQTGPPEESYAKSAHCSCTSDDFDAHCKVSRGGSATCTSTSGTRCHSVNLIAPGLDGTPTPYTKFRCDFGDDDASDEISDPDDGDIYVDAVPRTNSELERSQPTQNSGEQPLTSTEPLLAHGLRHNMRMRLQVPLKADGDAGHDNYQDGTDPVPIGQLIPHDQLQQQDGEEPLEPIASEEDALNDNISKSAPKEIGIPKGPEVEEGILDLDAQNLQVALNLEFLEAEFFLNSILGVGLEHIAPELVEGGPLPRGVQKANLDKLTSNLVLQFALQEVGHLRAIKQTLGNYYFGRPQLDISKEVFAEFIDKAFGEKLEPPFDVYANSLNYFLGVYMIPYVGLTGYVGASPNIVTPAYKRRIAGLLAVEAGQDAVTREYLYERIYQPVSPYTHTVGDFTEKISAWRNYLSHERNLDEGLFVQVALGAEKAIQGNVISADEDSLAYGRTPSQVLSTVYGTGDASQPGGFYPVGGRGKIAQQLLKKRPGL